MIEKIKKHLNHPSLGVLLSVTVIYVSLVAYASATNFKAGYLRYFGIDIRHVDYWPSVTDFMEQPIVVILAILMLLASYLLAAFVINGLHWIAQWIAKKKKWQKLLKFIDEKPLAKE